MKESKINPFVTLRRDGKARKGSLQKLDKLRLRGEIGIKSDKSVGRMSFICIGFWY